MKKSLFILVVIITLILSGVGSYAYFIYIPEKVEQKIIANFNAFGFENPDFGKITRKNGEIIFSDISLDRQNFSTIKEISVRFSLLKFLLSPDYSQEISVRNLELTGELSEDFILSISGWVDNKNFLQKLRSIPASIINIENSNINLLSDNFGGIKIDYDAQIQLSDIEDIIIKGRANSKQRNLAFNAKLNGILSSLDKLSLTADLEQLSMEYNDLIIRRGSGKLDLSHNTNDLTYDISIESEIASVNWNKIPLRDVHAVLEKGNNDNYNLLADGIVFGTEEIEWETRINRVNEITEANTTITPKTITDFISFLKRNNQLDLQNNLPNIILNFNEPVLSVHTTTNNGTASGDFTVLINKPNIEVGGSFAYNENNKNTLGLFSISETDIKSNNSSKTPIASTQFKMSSSGEFTINNTTTIPSLEWSMKTQIKDGLIDYGAFKIPNIKSEFLLSSKSNKKTKRHLGFRLPLKNSIFQNGKVNLNIFTKTETPLVKSIHLDIYDGHIKTQSSITKNGQLTSKNKLIVSDINIAKLFRDAGFKDIIITGQLGGVIPLQINKDKMTVSGGILQSQRGGIIRLPQKVIAGLFPGNSRKMLRIRSALQNYYYEYFEIRLDGDLNGRVMMTLNARGYDPKSHDKDPVDLNLQIETQISLLFRNLLK